MKNKATSSPAKVSATEPHSLHSEFSWLHTSLQGDTQAQFAALTRDVSRGAELCIQVAIEDAHNRETDSDTLFSANQIENLTMLACRALQMLSDEAERQMGVMNSRALEEQS